MELTMTAVLAGLLYFGLFALIAVTAARGLSDVITMFLLSFGLFQALRPALLLLGLDVPFPETLFPADEASSTFTTTVLGLSLFLFLVFLGVLIVLRSHVRGWGPFFGAREISIPRAIRVTLALTVLASLISLALLAMFGGPGGLITAAKVDKALSGLYVLRVAPAVGAVVASATFLDARRQGYRAQSRIALLCGVLNAGYVFLWGSRSLLVIVGAIIVLGLRPRLPRMARRPRHRRVELSELVERPRRQRIWLRIGIAVLLVIAVAGGLRMARDTLTRGEVQGVFAEASVWRQMSLGTNATFFDAAMLSFRDWPTPYEYRGGTDFVAGAVGVVPRKLWKDKPNAISPGEWFRQVYEPGKVNGWPMGAAALWYLNFGWLGVAVGGFGSGLLLGLIAAAQRRRPDNGFNTGVALVTSVYVVGIGIDSELLIRAVLWWVPLWLILRYVSPQRVSPRKEGVVGVDPLPPGQLPTLTTPSRPNP